MSKYKIISNGYSREKGAIGEFIRIIVRGNFVGYFELKFQDKIPTWSGAYEIGVFPPDAIEKIID